MANRIPPFVKLDGDSVVFNLDEGYEFAFYIPEIYFERKNAIIIGEFVNLLGIMDYTITDPKGKNNGLHKFYFPNIFLTKPYTIEKIKRVKLIANSKEDDYRVLRYKKGDIIIVSTKNPQDINNVEEFYRLFLSGKLPNTVRYDEMQNYIIDNMSLNGNSYNVNMQLFGILISEMCRAKNDLSKSFRLSGTDDMTAYSTINIRDIPKYIDPYASITSENWDNAVVNAITSDNASKSPMERLLMEQAPEG